MQIRRFRPSRLARRHGLRVADDFSGVFVEFEQLDAAPVPRADGHPQIAVLIEKRRRIDGVEIGACFGSDDQTFVRPFVSGTGGIERGAGDKPRHGNDAAESRIRVEEKVFFAHQKDIRRPHELGFGGGHGFSRPFGHFGQNIWPCRPIDEIGRGFHRQVVAGGVEVIFAVALDSARGIVSPDGFSGQSRRHRVATWRKGERGQAQRQGEGTKYFF